jgi:hypothetical protein
MQEEEIGRITVLGQLGQKVYKTPFQQQKLGPRGGVPSQLRQDM